MISVSMHLHNILHYNQSWCITLPFVATSIAFSLTIPSTIDFRKNPIMPIITRSQILARRGLFSVKVEGSYKIFFCDYKLVAADSAILSLTILTTPRIHSKLSFLKMAITNIIWMWTLIIAFPTKVALKKVLKGILKCPQVMPAKSERGLGIDAQARIVPKPYFYILSYMTILAFSMKVFFCFLFSSRTY